jgi:sugar lactone lactonase YvrE
MQSMNKALVFSPKTLTSRWKRTLFCVPAAITLLGVTPGFAAVPAVVADAQQSLSANISNSLYNPSSVAVAPNGTVYVADSVANRVYALTPNLPGTSGQATVNTTSLHTTFSSNLVSPQSVAVDAAGNLYIGDTPFLQARIVKVAADSTGTITNTSAVTTLYVGGLLNTPGSLAVSSGTLYIGDTSGSGGFYTLPVTGGTPKALTITGISGTVTPSALAISGSNLFIANSTSSGSGVYEVPLTGGVAKTVWMGSFTTQQPQGLAVDAAGDLFVLAQLPAISNAWQVLEIPQASTVSSTTALPFIIPSHSLAGNNGLAMDPMGNLDVVGYTGFLQGYVTQLAFQSPVYLGAVSVTNPAGAPSVLFNFELNAASKLTGFRAVTVGDPGSINDVVQVAGSGTCTTGSHNSASATNPYSCYTYFQANPEFVGTRMSAIQVEGATASNILSSSPVYELGMAQAQITYPLDVSATPLGLIQPQGVAVSGFNQTVYIADLSAGKVYSMSGLNGSKINPLPTPGITLSAPSAVAMNGEGDLYIADFNLGQVFTVPTTTGAPPSILNAGGLVQHPISLAVDELGDVYIGDAGPDGEFATSSRPGYVVVVPFIGSPFKLSLSGASIIFPQALAYNNATGMLAIGDGGDSTTLVGQLVEVAASGAATVISLNNSAPDPSGLVFDAASNLYVLDGAANTFSVINPNGTSNPLTIADTTSLYAPSALASSAGSQSFIIANLSNGTSNNLVFLNGNSSTLAFGNQLTGVQTASQTVTVGNIGNQELVFNNNFMTTHSFAVFSQTGGTCAGGVKLTAPATCSLSFAFKPTATTSYTGTAILNTKAYNTGVPVITLTGTGVKSAANVGANTVTLKSLRQATRAGRKSFASAKFK